MDPRFLRTAAAALLFLALAPVHLRGQDADDGGGALRGSSRATDVRIHVPRVDRSPSLDPSLDDPVWRQAATLDDWVQTSPGDNAEPVGRTEALFLHDDEALWIAIRAHDAPGGVRWATHRRDVVHRQPQDYIGLHIDTYNDQRRTFYFVTNPVGMQGDGIYRETSTGYVPWDGIFDTVGEVEEDGSGYRAIFRIPFRTLRFQDLERQVWGFSLLRRYGRSEAEDSPWPLDRDLSCEFCQMAEMVLEGVRPGRNIEVNPALVSTASADRPEPDGPMSSLDGGLEPSVSVKYGITPSLTVDGTLNPDFSQVEADAGQLEVNNRFALFFPETRPFFMEGADVFAMGIQPPGGGRAPLNLFHSRTMVEPDWGTKMSGKVGRFGVGALAVGDAASPPDLAGAGAVDEGAVSAVGRVTMDVGVDGYVGAMASQRGHAGRDDRVGALDGRLRVGDNLRLSGMAAASRFASPWEAYGTGAPGDDPVVGQAVHLQADWLSRSWTGGAALLDITPDFRAPLGFVPRTDQLLATGQWGWIWRGTGAVRRFQPTVTWERIWSHDDTGDLLSFGERTDESWNPALTLDLARATQVQAGYTRTLTVFRGETFPAQDVARLQLRSNALSAFQVTGEVRAGEGVIFTDRTTDGSPREAWTVEGNLSTVLRPHSAVRLDVGTRGSRIWRRSRESARESLYATALIPRLRSEVQFTKELGFRGIAEYRTQRFSDPDGSLALEEEEFLFDVLLSYVVNYGSALYLGWTELQLGDETRSLAAARRGGVAKITYVWRF